MKSAVITGVSSGIGEASARALCRAGYQVFGSIRRASDAVRLRSELGPHFHPLLFDVTDSPAITRAAGAVGAMLQGQRLSGLVLNAGVAYPGPLLHLLPEDFRSQLEVNLVSQLVLTQAFAPLLGTDPRLQGQPGRIITLSSVAGKLSNPFLGAYAASKHALEAFSHSLRRELMLYGIDVIIIAPGVVSTPIWGKEHEGFAAFRSTAYAPALAKLRELFDKAQSRALPASDIGELVLHALTTAKPKTRYAALKGKLANWYLPRLMPDRMLDKLVAGLFGLKKKG